MIVILNKDVKGTGKAGDVVKVSDGYARNMLIPKGLATEATQGNIRHLEKQKAITSKDIAEGLKSQHGIEVDKKKIQLSSPIKQTGEMSVDIKLYSEVSAELKVKVEAE